jgi:DNA-binding CsgD family transcriptional regulator
VRSRAVLTDRQVEIIRLVARGMSSKEIAQHEGISLHSVNTHVRRARSTLGVGNRAAAVAVVVRGGRQARRASRLTR